jgi:phosphopantothenoylcysteine synthetase/decarboxylase
MNILVTAGNTQTPIDRVRCITNIFSGRTGAALASTAHDRGHRVTLLTSHPELLHAIEPSRPRRSPSWAVRSYRSFEDLEQLMAEAITDGGHDAVSHAAAVSDYHLGGVYTRCV